jgi:hypothetical protein
MDMMIAILLWLQCMLGGGTYSQAQYDAMVLENNQTISQVQSSEPLSSSIWTSYGSLVPTVTIIENE